MTGINFSDQNSGRRILWGLSTETYQVVHIDDARNGRACDCICPGCRTPLIAAQGEKQAHHFRHAPDPETQESRPCANPNGIFETLTHLWAKQYIHKTKKLLLPGTYIARQADEDGCEYVPFERMPPKEVEFDRVDLEVGLDEFRPDCVAYIENKRLLIEVYVHHQVDDEKKAKVKKNKEPMVEICLNSACIEGSEERIKELLAKPAQSRWIYHPSLDKYVDKANLYFAEQRRNWEVEQQKLKQQKLKEQQALLLKKRIDERESKISEQTNNQLIGIESKLRKKAALDAKEQMDTLSSQTGSMEKQLLQLAHKLDTTYKITRMQRRKGNFSVATALRESLWKRKNEYYSEALELHQTKSLNQIPQIRKQIEREVDSSLPPPEDQYWAYAEADEEDEDILSILLCGNLEPNH